MIPSFPSDNPENILTSGSSSTQLIQDPQQPNFSAMAIRSVLALEKMAQIAQLAPKTYKAQMLARYGVKVDTCDYCACRYLGSFDSSIDVGEVVATAASSTNKLGQVAGRGVGAGNGHIKFNCDEDGIIMGMHYIRPQIQYNSDALNPFNRKLNRSDFYMPEFDALGMQPVFSSERQGLGYLTSFKW